MKTLSVSQIFKERIIRRAPDKMIEYLQDHILLAYRNSIIYIDLSRYEICGGNDISTIPAEYRTIDSHFFII